MLFTCSSLEYWICVFIVCSCLGALARHSTSTLSTWSHLFLFTACWALLKWENPSLKDKETKIKSKRLVGDTARIWSFVFLPSSDSLSPPESLRLLLQGKLGTGVVALCGLCLILSWTEQTMCSVAGEAGLPLGCYLTRHFSALTQMGITVVIRSHSKPNRKVILERHIVTVL